MGSLTRAATCSIRFYQPGDAQGLWEAARESVAEVYPWLPWCHVGYSLGEAEEWVRSRAQLAVQRQEFSFAIVDANGRFLGGCGLNQLNGVHRFCNLGYWVRTSATGQGVATQAVRLLSDFASHETDLLRLEIVCAVDNVRSQRVAERAGAQREGTLRNRLMLHSGPADAIMYSLVPPRAAVPVMKDDAK